MKRRQWTLSIISILFCAAAIMINPSQVKAGNTNTNAYRAEFDATYYYNTYPDVAAAMGNNTQALFNHYVTFGIKEGRSASAEFNVQAYRQRYADLQVAFGSDLAAYCRHYMNFGKAEGRNARADGQGVVIAVSTVSLSTDTVNEQPVNEQPANEQPVSAAGDAIGTCTTTYDANIPRANNVVLAAQRVNGVVVQPGQGFSFSQTVLPRTRANGYVEAPIFVSGKTAVGIGGGICQVSSTLYAAMISAGLPATERHPHSRPVDYLPKGYDATIAGNRLDLKFTNTFSRPLLIQASASNGVLTVTLVLQ